jgi:hypothetical protein
MKQIYWLLLTALAAAVALVGCGDYASRSTSKAIVPQEKAIAKAPVESDDEEAGIKASLAKLAPEDQKLAEAQRFCAVEEENRLGSMGVPVKVMIKEQPVFLCCKGCVKSAQKDPDLTLAKVQELKSKTAGATKK